MNPHQVSGRLLSVTPLALAALVALAADRISRGPVAVARPVSEIGDVADFVAQAGNVLPSSRAPIVLRTDPFRDASTLNSVAPKRNTSTVTSGAGTTRRLSAILVANDRPVAVVDDEVVGVGDVLRDGARVSRIQSDRVFLIEKDGKWRTLTLARRP